MNFIDFSTENHLLSLFIRVREHFREHSKEIIFIESTFLLKSENLDCKLLMLKKKGQICKGF